jgi:hypothetical protein
MPVKCLICEKDLVYDDNELVIDGGFVYIEFHYGSCHDQCKGWTAKPPVADSFPRMERLLHCDRIEGYICDSCFEKKQHLCKGFNVKTTQRRTKVVE